MNNKRDRTGIHILHIVAGTMYMYGDRLQRVAKHEDKG